MRRALVSSRRRARFLAIGILLFVPGGAISCGDLGDFTLGVCGNSVLDTGEDCEPNDQNGDPLRAGYCAPKGDPAECHYLCAEAGCPSGEYCGVDRVCRAPAQTFSLGGQPVSTLSRDIHLADFDGDGRADVLLEKRDGSIDLHLPNGRELGAANPLPADAREGVAVGYVNRDVDPANSASATRERADLVVGSGAALGALLGAPNGKLTVAAVSSYSFANPAGILATPSQTFSLPTNAPLSEALKPDTEVEGVAYDLFPSSFKLLIKSPYGGGTPPIDGPVPGNGSFGLSAADLSPVNLLRPLVDRPEDRPEPCDEVILTAPVDSVALIAYACGKNGLSAATPGQGTPTPGIRITVPSGVAVVGHAMVADLIDLSTGLPGADGHLDVLLPTSKNGQYGLFIAPGDGTLSYPGLDSNRDVLAKDYCQLGGVAQTLCSLLAVDGVLAMQDLNDDGLIDVVTRSGVELSTPPSATSPNGFYSAAFPSLTPWSEAVVADVNGDGHLDVVSAPGDGRDGLEVLYGSSDSYFNPSVLSTSNPIGLLTVGDFDGDSVSDIVARAQTPGSTASCDVSDDIVAFFGRTSGGLEDGKIVGHLAGAFQIISGRLPRLDRRDSIFDFGVASHCGSDTWRISVFYGTADRLLDAPFLLTDQFGDEEAGNIASYKPDAIAVASGTLGASPGDSITLAGLATYDFLGGNLPTPVDTSELFIETSDATSLFKSQALVSLQPITDQQASRAAIAVGSFDVPGVPEVAVWLPAQAGNGARVALVSNFDCARAGGGTLAAACNGATSDPTVVDVTSPDFDSDVASVEKSKMFAADLDGDGRDDLVLNVVSNDGTGGLFFLMNTGNPGAPFTVMPVPGVVATSAALLVHSIDPALGKIPTVVFTGSFTQGSTTENGVFAISAPQQHLASPTLVVGTASACGTVCDDTTALATGDVDGDGLEDIATLSGNVVHVYYRDSLVAGTMAAAAKTESK